MTKYTPILEFTAQGPTVVALNRLYAQLQADPSPSPEITPIVVFLAFSIESYVNSVGFRHISIWNSLEKLPWKTKLLILHDKARKEAKWGHDPLQFAGEIFLLRDKLAHGKPEIFFGPIYENKGDAEVFATAMGLAPEMREEYTPKWYSKLNREWANESHQRYLKLMSYIGSLFRLHASDYLMLSQAKIQIDEDSPA